MTNNIHQEYFSPDDAVRLARKAWDAIQAAEFPKNMANLPKDMDNSTELKALARTARDFVSDKFQWLAVDADGEVWAYELKPIVDEFRNAWDSDHLGEHWEIGAVAPPADFRNEIYEIDKLLNDDNK